MDTIVTTAEKRNSPAPSSRKKLKNLIKRGDVWYFVKIAGGKLTKVSLNTGDLELAKARRNELAKKVFAEKWKEIDTVRTKRDLATIGEVLARYAGAVDLQLAARTLEDNAWALRHVVRRAHLHSALLPNEQGRTDDVDKLPCSILDAALVQEWQRLRMLEAGADKLKRDAAAVSANSILSQARSVFSKKALSRNLYAGMNVPDVKGFLTFPKLQELKRDDYRKPDDDLLRRVWRAAAEMKAERPAIYLVFLLASEAGLRKGEICGMRWRWFVRTTGGAVIVTRFETDFIPKGKRERVIPIRAGIEEECRELAAAGWWSMLPENLVTAGWSLGPGDLVIPGTPRQQEERFREFGEWLDSLG